MGGQTFFFPTPSPKILQADSEILTDSRSPGDPQKTLKIFRKSIEGLTRYIFLTMGPGLRDRGEKTLIGVDYILMDTPSHSA